MLPLEKLTILRSIALVCSLSLILSRTVGLKRPYMNVNPLTMPLILLPLFTTLILYPISFYDGPILALLTFVDYLLAILLNLT